MIAQTLSRSLHVFFGFGPCCRFEPTCSRYFSLSIKQHGPLKGFLLGIKRLCHCHPWGGYGLDPVPEGKK